MRRTSSIAVIAASTLLFAVACGNDSAPEETPANNTPAPTFTKPTDLTPINDEWWPEEVITPMGKWTKEQLTPGKSATDSARYSKTAAYTDDSGKSATISFDSRPSQGLNALIEAEETKINGDKTYSGSQLAVNGDTTCVIPVVRDTTTPVVFCYNKASETNVGVFTAETNMSSYPGVGALISEMKKKTGMVGLNVPGSNTNLGTTTDGVPFTTSTTLNYSLETTEGYALNFQTEVKLAPFTTVTEPVNPKVSYERLVNVFGWDVKVKNLTKGFSVNPSVATVRPTILYPITSEVCKLESVERMNDNKVTETIPYADQYGKNFCGISLFNIKTPSGEIPEGQWKAYNNIPEGGARTSGDERYTIEERKVLKNGFVKAMNDDLNDPAHVLLEIDMEENKNLFVLTGSCSIKRGDPKLGATTSFLGTTKEVCDEIGGTVWVPRKQSVE